MLSSIVQFILSAFWIILPAYFANSSPVYFTSRMKNLHPIDFNGKFLDGRPILGKGKTFEGTISGIAVGTVVGWVQVMLQKLGGLGVYFTYQMSLELAFALASAAIIGDMIGSFIKRRMGKKRGEESFLLDTLDFLVPSLLVVYLMVGMDVYTAAFLMVITPMVHRAANILAYKLGMKDVPW